MHKSKLGDPSVKWVGAYKSVLWSLVLPTGPKNPSRPGIEVFGDDEAVEMVCELIRMHGWTPVVVLLIAYAFYGLDAIGDEIEDPFGLDDNDLPLSTLSRMIEVNVRQRLGETDLPELLSPQDGLLQ